MHTSPSGKVYIGIAKDVKHRWRSCGKGYKGSTLIWYAIQKYGWDNFSHEILADSLTREEASQLEKETIAKYNSTDPAYGYNLTNGGYDGVQSEETREKKSASLMGHSVSDDVKDALRTYHSIKVICLDDMVIYENAKAAGDAVGVSSTCVNKVCNGKAASAGGYHFAKLSDYRDGTIPVFIESPKGKPVMCVETGEVFINQQKAAQKYGVTSQAISHACTGKVETSAKMHWKFITKEDAYGRHENL